MVQYPISHSRHLMKKILYQFVVGFAKKTKGKLLDFGCGNKPYRSLFNVEEYIGLDIENPGHLHDNEDIDIYFDGIKIPFEDNHFDYIVSIEVFEHIFNLPDILREINRVLKPGGTIFFTCPFVWIEHEMPYDYARYTHPALLDLLTNAGFDTIEMKKGGNFVIALGQLINVYLSEVNSMIHRKVGSLGILTQKIFGLMFFFTNCIAIVMSYVLPVNTKLYLVNIVSAQKKNTPV